MVATHSCSNLPEPTPTASASRSPVSDIAIPIADSKVSAPPGEIQEGRDGWLFLRLGTNRQVIRFLHRRRAIFPHLMSNGGVTFWQNVPNDKDKLGARYFHFIVPDKLTVYRDNYIGSLSDHYDNRPSRAPTIPARGLERRGLSSIYIDVASQLIAERDARLLFYW